MLEFEQPGIMCINISITEDLLLEDEEIFTITLKITDENVILNTSLATILIEDRVSCITQVSRSRLNSIATEFKYRVSSYIGRQYNTLLCIAMTYKPTKSPNNVKCETVVFNITMGWVMIINEYMVDNCFPFVMLV